MTPFEKVVEFAPVKVRVCVPEVALELILPVNVRPPESALLTVLLAVNTMVSLVETAVVVPVTLNVPPLRVMVLPPAPKLLPVPELPLMVATAKVPPEMVVPPV